ncbi:hypothetical protein COV11_04415 [Candidatus Woesearchaeota archaeon CG10_big_fil_rev_8_21_14_0_10_30_7]|nr:MAG: hypothetical protein COV11_04415 [Candidatus Woesearchaeota archaeon CG10_big_fil_rev_8_21_14_0_10_30_7]
MEIVSEIIPKKIRGSFMAYRDRALITVKMITILAAGFFIDRMSDKIFGYNVLFSIALFFGLGSIYYINRLEVKQKPLHKIYHFKDFFKTEGPFRKFLVYSVFFDFAHMICSPFFIVYLLKNVGLSLGTFSLVIMLEALASIFTQKRLGKFSDKYGDKKVHMICLVGAASTPLLYLLFIHPSTVWMLIPVSIINGFTWGGYNLTRRNLLLDVTSTGDREIQIAEYRTLTAFPMFIAPLIGGLIADKLTFVLSGLPLLFAIAFILRALSGLLIFRVTDMRVRSEKSTVKIFEEFLHFPHFTVHHFSNQRHNKLTWKAP